jgi:hypothetical protein
MVCPTVAHFGRVSCFPTCKLGFLPAVAERTYELTKRPSQMAVPGLFTSKVADIALKSSSRDAT